MRSFIAVLRGDSPRLQRCRGALSGGDAGGCLTRVKPFNYVPQRDIVFYAHFQHLDYFATECKYATGAFRGYARKLIKDLEAANPSAVLDIVHSGNCFVVKGGGSGGKGEKAQEQKACSRCGYLSSQEVCQACGLIKVLEQTDSAGNPSNGSGNGHKNLINW